MKYLYIISILTISLCAVLNITACGTSKSAAQNTDTGIQTEVSEPKESTVTEAEQVQPEEAVVQPEEAVVQSDSATETGTEESTAGEAPEQPQTNDASTDEEIPADFVRCEIRIRYESVEYNAQAAGPTIEEARDNAAEEACAIPCAAEIEQLQLSEDETEAQLDACTDKCLGAVEPIGEICFQNGQNIYSSGEMSEPSADQQE